VTYLSGVTLVATELGVNTLHRRVFVGLGLLDTVTVSLLYNSRCEFMWTEEEGRVAEGGEREKEGGIDSVTSVSCFSFEISFKNCIATNLVFYVAEERRSGVDSAR
jgi:hypothetical protein